MNKYKNKKELRERKNKILEEFGYKVDHFGFKKEGRPYIYSGFILISTEQELRYMLEQVEEFVHHKEKNIEEDAKS